MGPQLWNILKSIFTDIGDKLSNVGNYILNKVSGGFLGTKPDDEKKNKTEPSGTIKEGKVNNTESSGTIKEGKVNVSTPSVVRHSTSNQNEHFCDNKSYTCNGE